MDFIDLHKTFEKHVEKGNITGTIFGVYEGEKTLTHGVYGYFDCAKKKILTKNALFRLASMTKPITAVAILILHERGLVDLDAPIGKYIEGFNHGGVGEIADGKILLVKSAREITVRDCLCHASGLGSGAVGTLQFNSIKRACDLAENVGFWKGAFLDFEPMSKQTYSGAVAFEVLAYVVEKASKKPFLQFLQEEIFSPLGMQDTKYALSEKDKPFVVEMNTTGDDGKVKSVDMGYKGYGGFEAGYTGGSAGLFSTFDDYLNFAKMLALGGKVGDKRILSEESLKLMATEQISINDYQGWGLGVRVVKQKGDIQPLPVGSFGWSGAYGSHFWIEPQKKRYAVFMMNKADVCGAGSPFIKEFENLVQKEY